MVSDKLLSIIFNNSFGCRYCFPANCFANECGLFSNDYLFSFSESFSNLVQVFKGFVTTEFRVVSLVFITFGYYDVEEILSVRSFNWECCNLIFKVCEKCRDFVGFLLSC